MKTNSPMMDSKNAPSKLKMALSISGLPPGCGNTVEMPVASAKGRSYQVFQTS
jgi:hypothetical protein